MTKIKYIGPSLIEWPKCWNSNYTGPSLIGWSSENPQDERLQDLTFATQNAYDVLIQLENHNGHNGHNGHN